MSYYKGGRGSGGYRGSSYRGSRGGGDTWRGSRGGNSFSSSSRGNRYSYPSPTYDSRSRSSYQGGGADRYSRGNRDEPYHRYSQDVNSYSARDYSRALSPEPPRKRARPESSPTYLGPRRSHERSFTGDYSSSRSYYDKGGASSSGGGGYLGEKVYTREVRERGSDFGFRKPAPRGGGYRGRTRGFRSTSFLRKRDSFAIRKRAALSSRSDYIRRLKQLRLRRRLKAVRRQQKGSDDDDDDEVDDDDLDLDQEEKDLAAEEDGSGVEEEEEEEEEEEVGSSGQEEGDENEENEGQGEKDEDQEGEAAVKKEENAGDDSEKKEGDEEEKKTEEKATKKKVVKKVKKKVTKKSEKEEGKAEDGDKDGEDKEKDDGEEGEKQPLTDFLGQPFIKLKCPHCHHACVTFKEYSKHLDTRKHQLSMQDLFTKLRKILSGMRMEQRKKQRILDEECKAKNMRLRTFFCSICKLNYRTLKSHHQASSSHRKISEFLLPFCKVCRMWFKSAWSYEVHLCELSHIKKKARLEKLSRPPAGKDDSLLADREENDMLDTSSFMILDSVGSGDDSDAEKSEEGEEKKEGEETEEKADKDTEKKKKKKSEIKLGAEHCKLVQVYYCDLCKIYLPRLDDKERALTIHCRSRTHLQRYVRINSRKNDENLRRKAVRLHKEKQKLKEKEKKKEEPTPKEEENTGSAEGEAKSEGKEEGGKEGEEESKEAEEKTWNEVDKDLSDLLHEGEDDEETPKERYDRFRKSGDTEVNGTDPAPDN